MRAGLDMQVSLGQAHAIVEAGLPVVIMCLSPLFFPLPSPDWLSCRNSISDIGPLVLEHAG